MIARRCLLVVGAVVVLATALCGPTPRAVAAHCSDVAVVFARGTQETFAPLGATGKSFVETLRLRLPGKSVHGYAVTYPASADFANRARIARGVIAGVEDAQRRIRSISTSCPRTKIVLGGYSQGAVVASYAASKGIAIPRNYARYGVQIPSPMPVSVAPHLAAIVLFAAPSPRWISDIGAPPITIGPIYAAKTTRYCIPGDVVCDGAPVGTPNGLHVLYAVNGMNVQAADYVAARI
ncbi:MAG: cutinase family protein [Gordonia sp. (in: high G+C Gram-positive bacteria)]